MPRAGNRPLTVYSATALLLGQEIRRRIMVHFVACCSSCGDIDVDEGEGLAGMAQPQPHRRGLVSAPLIYFHLIR
jgi:hypothetical protein